VYIVRWRVLSSYDGHASSGFFLFGVGQQVPRGLAGQGTDPVPLVEIGVRWLAFAAAVGLVGGAVFQALVLRPALAPFSPGDAGRAAAVIRVATIVAAGVLIAATVLDFLFQAAGLLGVPWRPMVAGGALWGLLGGTRPGWSALVRIGMALIFLIPASPAGRILRVAALLWALMVAGIVVAFGGPGIVTGAMVAPLVLTTAVYGVIGAMVALVATSVFRTTRLEARGALPLAGALLLAGFTLSSHAAADGPLALIADWLHLVAAASWTGGLLTLLLVLGTCAPPARAEVARRLVPRFSTLAGVGLVAVILTGLYSAILRVPAVQAMTATPYGRLLTVKLLLVAALAALGAVARYLVRPRLEAPGRALPPSLLRRFMGLVSGEAAAAALILGVVALLTITPPAAITWKPARTPSTLRLAGAADDVRVDLAITPAEAGWNRFEAVARGQAGPLAGPDVRLLLRLTKLDEPLDPVLLRLGDQGGGRFVAEDAGLGLPGWWEVEVIVRRRGRLDVSTVFPLRLGDLAARPPGPSGAALLVQMTSAMSRVRSWREAQQLTDGAGNVATSAFDLARPDRLRYRTAEGTEAVIIGRTQYLRSGGSPWEVRALSEAFTVDSYLGAYTAGAQAIALGRQMPCEDEACAVVLWEAPGGSAAFAALVGRQTHRLHRLFMAAPSHYMTVRLSGFNADVRIAPPR